MKQHQAIDYLEATTSIPLAQMSKSMVKLLNAAARVMHRNYPNMAGWYDPEFAGPRIDLWKHLHPKARATAVIPQSPRLLELTAKKFPDPFQESMKLFGL